MIKSSAILEINLKNLIHNYNFFKKIAKDTEVGATIKANAYGIGDKETFSCLYKIGCRNFFVATLKEGVNLIVVDTAHGHTKKVAEIQR